MWIFLLGVALFALLVAVAAFMQARHSAKEAQENEVRLNQRIDVLEKELSAMMDGAFGVANQLQKVESNLKNTVQQQEHIQQRDMGNLPYNEAVRRVSGGADVDELVEHCGLSRSEAELVKMLHKKSTPDEQGDLQNEQPTYEKTGQAFNREPGLPYTSFTTELQSRPPEPSQLSPVTIDDDLPLSDDGEPLFDGDLAGDAFQLALERARELHSKSAITSRDKAADTSPKRTKSKSESDERH